VDFVIRLITLLEATPRDRWESAIRTELRGTHYISSATGRQAVRDLIASGIPARTARWKVRGR
jgi:hypothetical protein